jgi:hypothetical protein
LEDKELQDSHLMPRSLYKKARGSGGKGNQDPYVVTKQGGKQSSHQTTDYVFCRECEQRFSINGEDYVMRLVTKQNGDFPLLEMLTRVPPTRTGPDWKVHSFADTPNINREKIAYFAISVFWRASVHTWEQENGEKTRIDLGKKYNEEIRRYLLGETLVPKNASLQVIACSDVVNQKTFFTPRENQKVRDLSVIFLARGILFFLRMSNTLTGFQQRLSIVNDPHGWITTRNCGDRPVWTLG